MKIKSRMGERKTRLGSLWRHFEFVTSPCYYLLSRIKNFWFIVVRQHSDGRGGLQLREYLLHFRSGHVLQQFI